MPTQNPEKSWKDNYFLTVILPVLLVGVLSFISGRASKNSEIPELPILAKDPHNNNYIYVAPPQSKGDTIDFPIYLTNKDGQWRIDKYDWLNNYNVHLAVKENK